MLENYLRVLTSLRGAGTEELSYYPALHALLDEIGSGLRPKVYSVVNTKNIGAGQVDLSLFDENQPNDQKPARGIVEAKPVSHDLLKIARSEQVARYVAHYGQALVTNYYQFMLVTRGENGELREEERYNLAENASAFWTAAAHPRALAQAHDTPLRETLMRMMRRNAPLSSPQDVAWILASYAREAKARMAIDTTSAHALDGIQQQLEAALGVRFESEAAEEFFQSTLVQTLFYGVFSAWVLWHERHPGRETKFDLWRDTRRLNVPVVQELFEQFSASTTLPTSVEEVLNWTVDALNRVDRAAFFERFNKGDAIQYFYEPFLEAFDPELRRQLGVWYTPPEVVDYMVARVDAALKEELGIADGLADPHVYVLDPCCGTGAYLVSVLRRMYETFKRRDGAALAGQQVQVAMRERVFGFEILPAPFVVAHLQIGMLLSEYQAPLATGQRAGVYLTNALTGWDTPDTSRMRLMFPELQKEREAADIVKRGREILVILGNPPYSGFAGVAVEEERALTNAYRTVNNPALPRPQGQGLNDLYVRFYRMAERRIAEQTGRGVVSFISNYSWLDGLSHPGMRERYLEAFDRITIDNLNGDKYRTGKTTPEGKPDPSIFSTEFNREGIQVGTAIVTMVRRDRKNLTPQPPLHEMERGSQAKTGQGMSDIERGSQAKMGPSVSDMERASLNEKMWGQKASGEWWQLLKPLAREKRHEPTAAEDHLWQRLRNRQIADAKFRRQHAIDRFIVDFYCAEAQLVVEVDGEIHQYTQEEDQIRQGFLESLGLRVLRFTNETVLHDTQAVINTITTALTSPPAATIPPSHDGIPDKIPPLHDMERGLGGEVAMLYYRDLWGTGKRAQLRDETADGSAIDYNLVAPSIEIGLPYNPRVVGADYFAWPKLMELFPTAFPGVKTSRDDVVVDIDRERLEARMTRYFNPTVTHAEIARTDPGFMSSSARYDAESTRETLVKRGFLSENIVRYAYRPFDVRWLYWEPETKLLDEKRSDYFPHVKPDNLFLIAQQGARRGWTPPQFIRSMGSLHLEESGTNAMPLYLYDTAKAQPGLFERIETTPDGRRENISDLARGYLENLTPQAATAETLFYHALAVLHSPAYRVENAGALRQDWPRVPLPKSSAALMASAALGREVAALLDVETPVAGVTQGDIRPELLSVAFLATVDGSSPNLRVNARWGYLGQGSAVMPGQGKMVKRERADGSVVYDIYLNETMIWRGVPLATWEYTLGSYQVLKKWLSYRETAVLGRPLTVEDVREFMHIARRITALLMLNEALDANYRAVVVG